MKHSKNTEAHLGGHGEGVACEYRETKMNGTHGDGVGKGMRIIQISAWNEKTVMDLAMGRGDAACWPLLGGCRMLLLGGYHVLPTLLVRL